MWAVLRRSPSFTFIRNKHEPIPSPGTRRCRCRCRCRCRRLPMTYRRLDTPEASIWRQRVGAPAESTAPRAELSQPTWSWQRALQQLGLDLTVWVRVRACSMLRGPHQPSKGLPRMPIPVEGNLALASRDGVAGEASLVGVVFCKRQGLEWFNIFLFRRKE
jgi:hypothetical protein